MGQESFGEGERIHFIFLVVIISKEETPLSNSITKRENDDSLSFSLIRRPGNLEMAERMSAQCQRIVIVEFWLASLSASLFLPLSPRLCV